MIEQIIDIAINAGNIILDVKKKGYTVSTKSDLFDFVTTADLESEKYILSRLKKEFPKDSILSEEKGNASINKSKNVWMIDPLDGTKNFKNGGKGYAVMIGLCQNGKPILGVIYAPAMDMLIYAQKGKGAYIRTNGKDKKLHVSNIKLMKDSKLITRVASSDVREEDKLYDYLDVKERIPESSVGIKLGLIAEAKAEFHISSNSKTSKWDTCAPQIILEEAGGLLTDIYGKPLDYNQKDSLWKLSFIASNKIIHQEIIKNIKEYYSLNN